MTAELMTAELMTMTEDGAIEDAVKALAAASSVTLLCHVNPDADTIGSGLALGLALDRRGVPVQVSFARPAEVPVSMRTLPGIELLVPPQDVRRDADLVVTVDCGSLNRLGSLAELLTSAAHSLVLDHHRSNTRYGEVNVVDDEAESTTSLIARILDEWGVDIDRDIAHCLFAGLVTDTGSFRWVRAGTHELAERLIATGIDSGAIARELLDTHPFGWLPMLSQVLGSARLEADAFGGAGLVYAVVRRKDVGDLQSEEIESVIDIVRTTAEAGVAAVFKETAAGPPPEWTVSLRSRDGTDVAVLASALGGGGHRFAAGYTAIGSAQDVVAALLAARVD